MSVPHIVILGGGFGGAYAAQALSREVHAGRLRVTLIDRHNYFVFYPLLVEAGTGSLHPRHAVVSIRSFAGSCRFLMAEVSALDLERQTVRCRIEATGREASLAWDHLVVAVGSVTSLPPIPGLSEHAFQVKTLGDAVALRDRVVRLLEAADATDDPAERRRLLHLVVVGASFTGVEVAGEFHAFLQQAARRYANVATDDCRVTLVELAQRILPALDPDMATYAADQMRRRGIEIRLETATRAVESDGVVLESGQRLDAATTIWCAGIAPNPLVASLGLPTDERGYLLCEPDLRVMGQEHVWGIGDIAVNPDPEGYPYPATAQSAVREGAHLAANLKRVARGEPPRPFVTLPLGTLAAIGCRTGVAKVLGLKLSGLPAWFLWRTVYLLKMPGPGRKLRVAMDWTLDFFFKRDFVELGLHRSQR